MVQIYPCLHSTFKDLFNDTSHTQIRVKTKKLWLRQVGQNFLSQDIKLCHNIENYVTIKFSVAIDKQCRDMVFCCNKETMLRHRKLCCDIVFYCNIANYVATEKKLCCDINTKKTKKRPKINILACFQAHFILGL